MGIKDLSIYRNKKVFITGHTGFKGSWLSVWLHSLGAKVTGYALEPEFKDGIFNRTGIGHLIQDLRGDIRNYTDLLAALNESKPEIVFHLAAQPLVLRSYNNPLETFETNVIGTANVLEAVRHSPSIKACVIITTDKCYENREWVYGYRETDSLGGYDPYSASKASAELVTSAYRKSYFSQENDVAIASARAGNVIGGGDMSEYRLLPDLFKAIRSGSSLEVRNPESVRPWQHVLEPLGGYLLLALALLNDKNKYAGAWNFGPFPQDVHTVRELVEKTISYIGTGNWIDKSDRQKPHEAGLLMLDISKAIHVLTWKPVLNFEETIQFTSDWYMSDNTNMFEFTLRQIDEYQRLWTSRNEI